MRLRRKPPVTRRDAALRELRRLAESDGPIVAGPWTGGIAQELLYWIPLLNWLTTEGEVEPARITAVSRGGADAWYSDVAGAYVDLYDHFSPTKVHDWHESRTQGESRHSLDFQKHDLDDTAIRVAARATSEPPTRLHPSILRRLHGERTGSERGRDDVPAVHRFLPSPGVQTVELPAGYAVLLLDIGDTIADTGENRAVLERFVEQLADQTSVVLVRSSIAPDARAGEPFLPGAHGRLIDPVGEPDPRDGLRLLTEVVSRASLLAGSYSELSFLGPYLATPTLALYSRGVPDVAELEAVERASRRLDRERQLFRARHLGSLRAAKDGEETAVSLI